VARYVRKYARRREKKRKMQAVGTGEGKKNNKKMRNREIEK
jgi:hypothetical protein